MPKYRATRPIKYRGVIYAAGDLFDVEAQDERAVTRGFGAELVVGRGRPVREAASVSPRVEHRVREAALRGDSSDDDAPAGGSKRRGRYSRRDLKAE